MQQKYFMSKNILWMEQGSVKKTKYATLLLAYVGKATAI